MALRIAFRVEEIPGRHGAVRVEFEYAAVEAIGSRSRDGVEDGSGRSAGLRVIVAGQDIHLLNRFEGRHVDGGYIEGLAIFQAVQSSTVRRTGETVGFPYAALLRVEDWRHVRVRRRHARSEINQSVMIPIEQRRLADRADVQGGRGFSRIRLHQDRPGW